MLPPLAALEARVLGVLVEKARTVPDSYPLSLNALTLGCNQKNNRDPVMQASEREVQAAIGALRPLSLVIESSGSRVLRYGHNLGRVLNLDDRAVAVLASLMLRGPQTIGELRNNADRLHRFPDLAAVESVLRELAARPDDKGGPLAMLLPRAAGERESRWAHLLSGPVEPRAAAPARVTRGDEVAALRADLQRLTAEVAELRASVERILRDTGPGA